jgi:hypothetical protein
VLRSSQKLTLGLLAIITLEVVPFRRHAQFPALLLLFKCILEVVFCEHTILPQSPKSGKNGGLSVLSSIGETEKSTVGGG